MKIIEALKELPIIEKRITNQNEQILLYSGLASNETAPFDTEDQQRFKVQQLIQSNQDLCTRYELLKLTLSHTNNLTKVTINEVTKPITQWIAFKAKTQDFLVKTYKALDYNAAVNRTKSLPIDVNTGYKISKMYKEEDKNKALESLRDLNDRIDAQLEIVNATTDLIEL